ncbi:MAG: hypothetical protein HYZ45_10715 [Burkholderiales bacterium]|nr:hypothetical protein [Burkholderiales bacterium]
MPKSNNIASAVHYRVGADNLHNHLFQVTLTIANPAAQQVLDLPVWIPGSYLVREFSKHLQQLSATQGKRKLQVTQHDIYRIFRIYIFRILV